MVAIKGSVNKKVTIRPELSFYVCSACILLLTAAFFLFAYKKLPPEVPLFYGNPIGAKQITDKNYLLFPLALSLAIIVVNYFFASLTKDTYLRLIFAVLSVLLSLISAIAVIKVILLVGNL